jgi:transcriptional regulator with XRE-family HTH domain
MISMSSMDSPSPATIERTRPWKQPPGVADPKANPQGNPKAIGARIKAARLKKDMVQEDLAEAVGVRGLTISRLELGKVDSPKTSTLAAIARVLDVSTDWLLNGPSEETRLERDDGPSDATKALLQRYFEGRGKDLSLAVKGALVDACRRLGEPKDERDLDDMARVLARGFELRAEQQPPTEEELQGYIYVGPKKPKG